MKSSVLILLVGLTAGGLLALTFTRGEINLLRELAEAQEDSLAAAVARADSAGAELDLLMEAHADSVRLLQQERYRLQDVRVVYRTRTDTILDQLPDSLGLREAIVAERLNYEAEISALEDIVASQAEVMAELERNLELERTARYAAEESAHRWKTLAEEYQKDARNSKLVAWGAAILGIVLAVVK